MSLPPDLTSFLKKERGMVLLFVGLVVFYSVLGIATKRSAENVPSPSLEQIKDAEKILQITLKDPRAASELVSRQPFLNLLFVLLTLTFAASVFYGVLLDLGMLFKRAFGLLKRLPQTQGETPVGVAACWGIGDIFKVVTFYLALTLAVNVFISLAERVLASDPQQGENWALLFHTFVTDLGCVFFIVHAIRRVHPDAWKALGLRVVRFWRQVGVGFSGYCAVLPVFLTVLALVVFVSGLLGYEPPPHPLVEVFVEEDYRNPALIAVSLVLACFFGPVVEETFFRGFCYPAFKRRFGKGWALILTSTFFSLLHQSVFAFWPVFLLGFALALLYEREGSLVPSIAMHMFHNSLFIGYFFLMKRLFLDPLAGGV